LKAIDMSSPQNKLRAAAIGTGKISEEHFRFLKSAGAAQLVAVCDLSPTLADFAAKRFGAESSFTDHHRMLAEAKPEVVHVLTPAATHPALVRDCLQADAHVIVEKPVAPTHEEFQTLWALSQTKGRRLIEDHNYRFNEPVLEIERMVAAGELGDIREVDVRMGLSITAPGGRYADAKLPHSSHRLPCGVLHEFITHLCYLALRFIPSIDRVRAAWSKVGNSPIMKFDDLDALVIGGDVHGRIRFTSQCLPETFTLIVRGTRGFAETDLFQPHLRIITARSNQQLSGLLNHAAGGLELLTSAAQGFRNKIMQHTPYEGLHTFLARTYESLQSGSPPPVSYSDMDRASRLIDSLLDEANRL
jgi:predicted dehydrogenase